MLKFSAVSHMKLGQGAGQLNALFNPKLPKLIPEALGVAIPESGRSVTIPYLESMRDELAVPLGAKTAVAEIDRLISLLNSGKCTAQDLLEKHNSIHSRMEDELAGTHFLYVPSHDREYFEAEGSLFGSDVESKFPCLSYDITEAGKCLALDRSTASAFHALRCLECGIRALARCLSIPDPTRGADRNWHFMLKKIATELDARWNTASRASGDGQMVEDAYAALAAMRNPWRNATMHFEHTYTREEAVHLLSVAGDFLRRLATRMDEDGLPRF